jgi:hypothetical protein
LGKTSALRFENVKFFKKPALYALKTLNFKLPLPSLKTTIVLPFGFENLYKTKKLGIPGNLGSVQTTRYLGILGQKPLKVVDSGFDPK